LTIKLVVYSVFYCLFLRKGGDATENFEDVGHSSDARELMMTYLIGELAEVNVYTFVLFFSFARLCIFSASV